MDPGILFDFNGVLIDDERVHARAMAEVLAPLGVALDEDEYFRELFVFDDRGAFTHVLTKHGRPAGPAEVDALVEAKRPVYLRRVATEATYFPGGAALVRASAARGVVGIVSGALRDEIDLALSVLGLSDAVSFVVSAEDTTRGKPDPEGYVVARRLARDFGARRLVAVEDSPGGVEAALLAEIAACGIAHTVGRDALRAAGASLVVDRIGELRAEELAAIAR